MKNTKFALAAGAALILSACGGGGGGGSTPVASTKASTLSAITPTNANNVASNAYGASNVIGASSSSMTGALTGVSVAGTGVSVVPSVLALIKQAGSAPQLLTGVAASVACSGGGTVSVDVTLHNQQVLSNGDSMTISAQNCVENGSTLNGTMSATFSNLSGDILNTSTFGATLDTRFSNLSVTTGSDTVAINGDMKIAISQTNATTNSVSISGQSLQATEQRYGTTVSTVTLTNYAMSGSTNGLVSKSAATFTVSGNSTGLGQFSYSVKNIQPFVNTGRSVPDSGSMIVYGNASSVTLTVVDNFNVRLDYSARGDGAITQSNTMSWLTFRTLN